VVVKDYRGNGILFRNVVGRFLVWRETKVLRRLQGLEGVPALHGRVHGLALIMEALPGRPVEGLEHERPLPPAFFDRLRDLVEAFHARGVAHCDLKRAPNILVGEKGEPYVVDWSAAIAASEFRPFPLSLVYRRFLLDDRNAVVKLQLRHRPGDVPPAELERYRRRGPLERLARRIRDRARKILQRLA
jgi:serine/threonine protein kinase